MTEQGYAACMRHRVQMADGTDVIRIAGFSSVDSDKCFCTYAEGSRYHEYGISTGSILLCEEEAPIEDGDLVLVNVEGTPTIFQYRRDCKIKQDGEKRILHNKAKAYAKIIGSFNIYC